MCAPLSAIFLVPQHGNGANVVLIQGYSGSFSQLIWTGKFGDPLRNVRDAHLLLGFGEFVSGFGNALELRFALEVQKDSGFFYKTAL